MRDPSHHPSLQALVPGSVVFATIPFENGEADKERPAIVIEAKRREALVVPCTSKVDKAALHGGVPIEHLQEAGLARPTAAIVRRVLTVPRQEIHEKCGELASDDWARVRDAVPARR